MGQKVEDVDLSFHGEGRASQSLTEWRCILHNGDNSYTSATLTKAGSTYAAVRSAAAQSFNAFAAAMSSLDSTWWSAIPTNHVNSDGAPLDYREAMRLWILAH